MLAAFARRHSATARCLEPALLARAVLPAPRPHGFKRRLCADAGKLLKMLRAGTTPEGSSFEEVRAQYLAMALRLHPDHHAGQSDNRNSSFLELQAAWEAYTRAFKRARGTGGFTRYGVGCSFDDSALERAERELAVEAASRGDILRRPIPSEV